VCSSHLNIPIISELLGKEIDVSGKIGFDKYFIFQNGKLIKEESKGIIFQIAFNKN